MKNLFILMLVVVAQAASAQVLSPAFDCSRSSEVDRLLNLVKADQLLGRAYQATTARLSQTLTYTYRYCTSDTTSAKLVVGFQKAGFDSFSRFEVEANVSLYDNVAKVNSVTVSAPDYVLANLATMHDFNQPSREDNLAASTVLGQLVGDPNLGMLIDDLAAFQRIGKFVVASSSTKTDKFGTGYSWTDSTIRFSNPNEANYELQLSVSSRVQPHGGNLVYQVTLANAYSGPYYGGMEMAR